ncbi:MAG: acyl carrier protein [Anaerolineae bacterium]
MSTKLTSTPLDNIIKFLHSRNPDLGEIAHDVDLIESRIIDSLDFIELVFLIEEATGAPVDLEEIEVDNLRTLQAIEASYFKG